MRGKECGLIHTKGQGGELIDSHVETRQLSGL